MTDHATTYRDGSAPSIVYIGTGRNRTYWLPLAAAEVSQ